MSVHTVTCLTCLLFNLVAMKFSVSKKPPFPRKHSKFGIFDIIRKTDKTFLMRHNNCLATTSCHVTDMNTCSYATFNGRGHIDNWCGS